MPDKSGILGLASLGFHCGLKNLMVLDGPLVQIMEFRH